MSRISILSTKLAFLLLLLISHYLSAAEVINNCPASKEYLVDLARYKSLIKVDQDYSCLIDLPSIEPKIPYYQLVNIQSSEVIPEEGIWKLTIAELKHKDYLQHKKLLLLDDGFSRVGAANTCLTLQQKGFDQTKILIGGAEIWNRYKHKSSAANPYRRVLPKNFIYEYFNGTVVVVTSDKTIANKLSTLGIDQYHLIDPDSINQKLSDLIINKTTNGYFPLVYIGDESVLTNTILHQYSNFYFLDGGLAALQEQLKQDVMTDMSRYDLLNVAACENAQL